MKIDRQIDRQIDRLVDRQIDRLGRQVDRQNSQNRIDTKQQVPLDRDRYARTHATIYPDRKINIDG